MRFNRRLAAVMGSMIVVVSLGLSGCGGDTNESGGGDALRMIAGEPTSLDPNLVQDNSIFITRQLFEPAFDIGPDGEVRNRGGESITVSEDARTFTVKLKIDYTWSDGSPVTSEDYAYSILRTLDPETASPNAYFLFAVAGAEDFNAGRGSAEQVGIETPSKDLLVIHTTQPSLQIEKILALPYLAPVPKAVVEKYGNSWTDPENIVTNGPYTLKERTVNSKIVLERNPEYGGETPAIKTVDYTITGQDPCVAQAQGFQAGQIDFATCVPGTSIKQLKEGKFASELKAHTVSSTQWAQFDNSNGPWTDLRVRQAFNFAVERQEIVDALSAGTAKATTRFVPDDVFPGESDVPVTGDEAQAKELLADAGYPDGEGFPSFTITTSEASGIQLRPLAELLLQRWETVLGVKGSIDVMEDTAFRAWLSEREPGSATYDIAITQWLSDYLDPVNWYQEVLAVDARHSNWKNPDFSAAVAQALKEADEAAREAAFQQAEEIVSADVPLVPLFNRTDVWLVSKRLSGLEHSPSVGMFVIGDAALKG